MGWCRGRGCLVQIDTNTCARLSARGSLSYKTLVLRETHQSKIKKRICYLFLYSILLFQTSNLIKKNKYKI